MESVPIFEDGSVNTPLVADFYNESIFGAANSYKKTEDKETMANEIQEQKEEEKKGGNQSNS
jgi:hypothetical protein